MTVRGVWQRFVAWATGKAPRPRQARGAFHGADISRLVSNWFANIMSPDEEIKADALTLRGRARSLVRDNPHTAGFIEHLKTQVVGPDGVRLQSRVKSTRGNLNESLNQQIEDAWAEWGLPGVCTIDGHDSFITLLGQAVASVAMDGEVFVQERTGQDADNDFGYALELVDPDLIDNEHSELGDGRRIIMGVHLNDNGRPTGYDRWRYHPQDPSRPQRNVRQTVPASDMIHLFRRYRTGQHRGVPWLTPILMRLRMLDGYHEAELVAARLAASKMGFFTSTGDDPAGYGVTEAQGDGVTVPGRIRMDAEPGLLEQLPHGMQFQSWEPDHPTTAFEGFERSMLRSMGVGVQQSYASFSGDLSDTNYSSTRVGLLAERDNYRRLQRWIIDHLIRRIYRRWLDWGMMSGRINVMGGLDAIARAARWNPRGFAWIDPLKEVQAIEAEIALGLTSRSQVAGERGRDYHDTVLQIEDELAFAAEAGVDVSGLKAGGATPPPPPEEIDEDEQNGGRVLPLKGAMNG